MGFRKCFVVTLMNALVLLVSYCRNLRCCNLLMFYFVLVLSFGLDCSRRCCYSNGLFVLLVNLGLLMVDVVGNRLVCCCLALRLDRCR